MEERNITVTLDKAREWYNSGNESLKEIALQAFSENELKFNFRSIKSLRDACKALDLKYSDVVLSIEERQTSLNNMIKLALEAIIK